MRVPRVAATAGLVCCVGLLAACDRQMLGLPRVPLSVLSPDGRTVAFVRNHPTIDGPSQSVWLGPVGGTQEKLRQLGEDMDWCNTIAWSSDSSTVSYLIQDARLLTADRQSGLIVSDRWLVELSGDYPTRRMVKNLSLSPDGRDALFQDCLRPRRNARYGDGCSDRRLPIR